MSLKSSLAIAFALLPGTALAEPGIHVWKNVSCGCCTAWMEHLQEEGFEVRYSDVSQRQLAAAKSNHHVPGEMASCHTALVGGYVIEGHVPAADILRLLAERPEAVGLAVPGMPMGSPGMDFGPEAESYEVYLLTEGGGAQVFSSHGE